MSPFSYIHAIITIFAGNIPDTRQYIWVALLASSCLLTYKNTAKQKGEAHFWMHSVFSEILEAYESCSSVDVTLGLEKKISNNRNKSHMMEVSVSLMLTYYNL